MNLFKSGSISRSSVSLLILLSLITSYVLIGSTVIYGIEIESEHGETGLHATLIRYGSASGQGTCCNFDDPPSTDNLPIAVVDSDSFTGRWYSASWNYHADGFDATFDDSLHFGDIFAGVFAAAEISHSKVGPAQSTEYVYNGLTARSGIIFQFSIHPALVDPEPGPLPNIIPTDIRVNINMVVDGSEKNDMGRAKAYFYLYELPVGNPRKLIRWGEVERKSVVGEDDPKTILGDTQGDMMFGNGEEENTLSFTDVPLKPAFTKYEIGMHVRASAYGDFRADDTSSESGAHVMMDPNIQFSPDFQDADDYKIVVSPGLINEDSASEPRITLSMEQDGEQVTKVDVDGGPVTFTAPKSVDPNSTTKYIWNAMNFNISDIDGDLLNSSYTFNASKLQPGSYTMHLITFPPLNPGRGSLSFEVFAASQTGPGIPGFPWESILIGGLIGFGAIYLLRKKKTSITPPFN